KCALTQGRPTESPLPLWERDRVRGLARQREATSLPPMHENTQGDAHCRSAAAVPRQLTLRRLSAPAPHPVPLPQRGEGTLLRCLAPVRKMCASPSAFRGGDRRRRGTRGPTPAAACSPDPTGSPG